MTGTDAIRWLFVYGTLKTGFTNAWACPGRRLPGRFRTGMPMPLWLVGRARLPWLIHCPGEGQPVLGEVVEVDAGILARLDDFEDVGRPGGYHRRIIAVEPAALGDPGARLAAWAYLKDAAQLADDLWRLGPLPEYTPDHARQYRPEHE